MLINYPNCTKYINFFSKNWMTFFETNFRFKSHEATDNEQERIELIL